MRKLKSILRWVAVIPLLIMFACSSGNTSVSDAELTATAESATMTYLCCTAAPLITPVTPEPPINDGDIVLSRGNPRRTGVYNLPSLRSFPAELWRVQLDPNLLTTPLLADELLYTASINGTLFAVDVETREIKWSVKGLGQLENTGAIAGETIIVGGINRRVRAFNRIDGSELWSFSTQYPIQGSPLVVEDQVYIGSDREFYSIDLISGNLRWSVPTNDKAAPLLTGMPAYDDGVIYTNAGNFLVALESETGRELWRVEKAQQFFSVAVGDSVVFAGNWDRHVYAFDRSNGNQLWQFEAEGELWSAPAVTSEFVYIGNKDQLYALNPLDGSLLWSFQAGGEPVSDPVITDGVIYFSDANHEVARRTLHLYALDASTGESLWVFEKESTYLPVPALGKNVIYVTSRGELIALR